MGQS
jgi:hypothetical protein